MMDGGDTPFFHQRTRQPLPKNVKIARVEIVDIGIILLHIDERLHNWIDITESEALEAALLETNSAHLSQSADDQTSFACSPLD